MRVSVDGLTGMESPRDTSGHVHKIIYRLGSR